MNASLFALTFLALPALANVQIFSRSLSDATHIEFTGRNEWFYDVRPDPLTEYNKKITVNFPKISVDDLKSLTGLRDPRVLDVTVFPLPNGGASLEFKVVSTRIKLFAYQTQDPVKLIFDLFTEEKPKVKAAKKGKNKPDPLVGLVARKAQPKQQGRMPAGLEAPKVVDESAKGSTKIGGIYDGGDKEMLRFRLDDHDFSEEGLIRASENIFVRMPPLIVRHAYLDEFEKEFPNYHVPPDKTEENKMFRLIVKLYNDDKMALVLRTLKFFREKYPVSRYDKEIECLLADNYYNLWLRDESQSDLNTALTSYRGLMTRYPEDPQRNRWVMLLGLNYMKANNTFGVLTVFQTETQNHPESPYYWQMRMAIANAYRELNRYAEALDELKKIENDPKSGQLGIEARFRRGDVHLKNKDYENAVREYREAIAKYPQNANEAPNAFFNLAEGLFQLKRYKESIEAYRDFLEKFPTHTFGGYAMTRLGEIFEIVGAPELKVGGAYLESYYRYRATPGGYIAKRHLDLRKFASLKEKEFEAAMTEAEDELPEDENIGNLYEFMTIFRSDAFIARKRFKDSLDLLLAYYKDQTHSPFLDLFKKRIVANYTDQVTDLVNKGDNLGAIQNYLKNSLWVAKSDRTDLNFQLGRAFENLNLFDDALAQYEKTKKIIDNASVSDMKYKKIFEKVPAQEELALRLARTYLELKKFYLAEKSIGTIKQPESMSSSMRFERAMLLARLFEEQEKVDQAIDLLAQAVTIQEAIASKDDEAQKPLDLFMKLTKLNLKAKKKDEAMKWAQKLVEAVDAEEKSEVVMAKEILKIMGETYLSQGKNTDALKAYQDIVTKYGEDRTVPDIVYKIGKIHFDAKNIAEAQKSWNGLKDMEGGQMWARLADENLQQAAWNQKYDKYMDRKPAGGKQ